MHTQYKSCTEQYALSNRQYSSSTYHSSSRGDLCKLCHNHRLQPPGGTALRAALSSHLRAAHRGAAPADHACDPNTHEDCRCHCHHRCCCCCCC